MKNLQILLLAALLFTACEEEEEMCDCDYITYEDGKETYRSTWDASCEDEVLSESTFTYSDGSTVRTRTVIKCK